MSTLLLDFAGAVALKGALLLACALVAAHFMKGERAAQRHRVLSLALLALLGRTLLEPVQALAEWAFRSRAAIQAARERFDAVEQRAVRVEFGRRLAAGEAEVRSGPRPTDGHDDERRALHGHLKLVK